MNYKNKYLLITFLQIALCACGGSGGGTDSSNEANSVKTEPVKVDYKSRVTITNPTNTKVEIPVEFSFEIDNKPVDASHFTIQWSFYDGSTIAHTTSGNTVNFSFTNPGYYMVKGTLSGGDSVNNVTVLTYVTVHRPYEQTIYAQRTSHFVHQEVAVGETHECRKNALIYKGKYTSLWLNENISKMPSNDTIIEYLTLTDHLFSTYSQLFGWNFRPGSTGTRTQVCESYGGAGASKNGIYIDTNELASTDEDGRVGGYLFESIAHELVHLWDFRSGWWIQGPDSGHAFTSGFEIIVEAYADTGQLPWVSSHKRSNVARPDFTLNHGYRLLMERYLSNSELNWNSYFAPELMNIEHEQRDIPENIERMLVQGGMFVSLYRMHGAEGIKRIFLEFDLMSEANPQWNNDGLPQDLRLNNFILAIGNGLNVDVSPYFDYWKVPLTTEQRAILVALPQSSMINDADEDGFSPLQGDVNDNDHGVYPNATEFKDGVDNNLDGLVDENVYDESFLGDLSTIDIELPALIIAETSDLIDEDNVSFSAPEGTELMSTVYAKPSIATVPYKVNDARTTSIFSGVVHAPTESIDMVYDWYQMPAIGWAFYANGAMQNIRVKSELGEDGLTPNPGKYELQLFIDDYEGKDLTPEKLILSMYPEQ